MTDEHREKQARTVPVLNIRRMDYYHEQDEAERIDEYVALPPRYLLTGVVPFGPPSMVLIDWLSMMEALGSGSLPSLTRTISRNWSWMRVHVPSIRQSLK